MTTKIKKLSKSKEGIIEQLEAHLAEKNELINELKKLILAEKVEAHLLEEIKAQAKKLTNEETKLEERFNKQDYAENGKLFEAILDLLRTHEEQLKELSKLYISLVGKKNSSQIQSDEDLSNLTEPSMEESCED